MNYRFLFTVFVAAFITACKKPKYKACFITAKDTFAVGETIWFYNCSDFDGASSQNASQWIFDSGQTAMIVSSGHDSISWTYQSSGIKNPRLNVGTKENNDQIAKQIIIQ